MAKTALLTLLAAILIVSTSAIDLDPRMMRTADSLNCDETLPSLMSCLPAVEGDDPEPPSMPCCSAILHINPDCLCSAIGDGNPANFPGMNVNAALQLPRECGRVLPKGFKCAGYQIPSYP